MATTPFRAVGWSPNELVGEDKMDQQSSNVNWLKDNTPRALYTASNTRRIEGVKIMSGRALIGADKSDSAKATVRFGNFFNSACEPNVTTGIVSSKQVKIFAVISGFGRLHPDHNGFEVSVNIANEGKKFDKITRSFFVTWQAMGF